MCWTDSKCGKIFRAAFLHKRCTRDSHVGNLGIFARRTRFRKRARTYRAIFVPNQPRRSVTRRNIGQATVYRAYSLEEGSSATARIISAQCVLHIGRIGLATDSAAYASLVENEVPCCVCSASACLTMRTSASSVLSGHSSALLYYRPRTTAHNTRGHVSRALTSN